MDLTKLSKIEACQICTLPDCNEESLRCVLRHRKGQIDAQYYQRNKDKRKAQAAANYHRTAAAVKKRVLQWKRNNRDLVTEQQRRYRARKSGAITT